MFAHLLQLQRRLGKDAFPLVEQTYFPNPKDMVSEFNAFLLFNKLNHDTREEKCL